MNQNPRDLYRVEHPNFVDQVLLDLATLIHQRASKHSVVSYNAQLLAASFIEQLGIDAAIDEVIRWEV